MKVSLPCNECVLDLPETLTLYRNFLPYFYIASIVFTHEVSPAKSLVIIRKFFYFLVDLTWHGRSV